ncbi:Cytosol aminopeptidase family, N-terminal domain [Sphingobium sp. AP50]|uniref:M17 family peptidase N-terminal domain-containing protein n=1 Tax=Sphingobium sp. AP50 TaxID=1884369 RepID=UPI0008AAE9D7|nr:M17 family peptidase N-terminal domain-containing protein [Sphingobium sp. AP50]SEJ90192.1 Cytosol aminopeptidase family, N-terminal domain [Sphingobium sp. AP50]
MAGIAAQNLGNYRSVHFQTGAVDPVGDRFDLLIVGMPEISRAAQIGGIACELDAALSGTLSHLRAGSVFDGRFGETLILSSPPSPVRSSALLIVGMGDADHVDAPKLGRLVAIAMRAAIQLDTRSAACLLNLLTADTTPDDVGNAASAMMAGALEAIDEYGNQTKPEHMDLVFDLRTPHIDVVADELKMVLGQWHL